MPEARFTPAYDNKIYQKYSKKTIQNKEKNKIAFLQDVDLPFHKNVPLICVTYALVDQNNLGMVQDVIQGILEQPVELVFTAVGSPKFQGFITEIAEKNSQKVAIADGSAEGRRKIYSAADIMLVASDSHECLEEMKNGMAYGVVPVAPPCDFAEDYNAIQEKGNAFIYNKNSPWSFFATLIRALENFRFPYDWRNIQIASME